MTMTGPPSLRVRTTWSRTFCAGGLAAALEDRDTIIRVPTPFPLIPSPDEDDRSHAGDCLS